jgi:uncharacterized protein YceK
MKKMILMLAMVPLLTGCGTFLARTPWRDEGILPRYYPATAVSGYCVAMPFMSEDRTHKPWPQRTLVGMMGIVDLPISLVTDTICLPYDAFIYRGRAYHDTMTLEERREIRDAALREQEKANTTSDGIRQHADGSPKPSR